MKLGGGVLRRALSSQQRVVEPYKLSLVQRSFLIPYFGVNAILDPRRGDYVAGFADALTHPSTLRALQKKMTLSASGRALLKEKRLVTEASLNLPALRLLPKNTLGKAYVDFMDKYGYSPNERSVVRFMCDEELAYVMARYRQVHDFWHVLCDVPPTILGEVALKWFEFRATGLPSCAISGLLGPLQLPSASDRSAFRSTYLPWAWRAGSSCNDLLSYDYELNLKKSLDEVREELQLIPAPKW